MDFAAIDFETANRYPSSICSIGVVVVRNNEIVDNAYSLVCPEPEFYYYWCSRVNGLQLEDTCDAPDFQTAWNKILPKVYGLPFFAHNARFDEGCLRAAYKVYQMDYPDSFRFFDTLSASHRAFGNSIPNHKLDTVSKACGFDLKNHHHALADAEACARIAITLEDFFEGV